jgi:hypothetical protein
MQPREGDDSCRIVVADDGVGLPENASWPVPGKLGSVPVPQRRGSGRD